MAYVKNGTYGDSAGMVADMVLVVYTIGDIDFVLYDF